VPGDEVLTRRGWRKVLHSQKTREFAEVMRIEAGGMSVELTPDHRVFVIDKGFIRADALTYADKLLVCQKHQSQSNSEAGSSAVLQTQNPDQRGFITPPTRRDLAKSVPRALASFMWRYGKQLIRARKSHLVQSSITRTKTRSTTTRAIWSVLLAKNTLPITVSGMRGPNSENSLRRFALWPRSGTGHQRAVRGIQSMAAGPGLGASQRPPLALSAGIRTGRSSPSEACTARPLATSEHPEWRSGISFRRLARSAERPFSSTERQNDPRPVAVPVERLSAGTRKTAVYDLTVEGEPEFFAGGILVHNCAIAFAGRANAAPMNVESHAGESITGDLMTKAW
jgi:Intein splicing domain